MPTRPATSTTGAAPSTTRRSRRSTAIWERSSTWSQTDPRLRGKTAVIVSADHGGFGNNHVDNANPLNYTIPFYVWGAGVAAGERPVRAECPRRGKIPARGRPDYTDGPQPIRNGDGGNLAMSLLGLPAIPDSLIDEGEDLAVSGPIDSRGGPSRHRPADANSTAGR